MSPYGRSTRNWKATEHKDRTGDSSVLTVVGEVETGRSAETPHLRPVLPRDASAGQLYLDLSILSAGTGETTKAWKTVRFERKIAPQQYSGVEIAIEGRRVGRCDVETPG